MGESQKNLETEETFQKLSIDDFQKGHIFN